MVIPRQGSELKAVEEACREASRTAEPLNDWNSYFRTAARCHLPVAYFSWRAASFSLEVTFLREKPTAKLLNNTFYAMFYCQPQDVALVRPGLTSNVLNGANRWNVRNGSQGPPAD